MTKLFLRTLLTATFLLLSGAPSNAQETRAIIELYTSQNCSSCPAADRIFEELATKKDVLALSCHVSYWDSPISKDDLAQDFCEVRQHGYIGIIGASRIYTPHMVINGYAQVVGSNGPDVKHALEKTHNDTIQSISLNLMNGKDGEMISFSLPNAERASYRLWGFGFINEHTRQMKRGENKGRTVTYVRPAKTYSNLGPWDGTANTHEFKKPDEDIDGMIIFAQKDGYSTIVAAGEILF